MRHQHSLPYNKIESMSVVYTALLAANEICDDENMHLRSAPNAPLADSIRFATSTSSRQSRVNIDPRYRNAATTGINEELPSSIFDKSVPSYVSGLTYVVGDAATNSSSDFEGLSGFPTCMLIPQRLKCTIISGVDTSTDVRDVNNMAVSSAYSESGNSTSSP